MADPETIESKIVDTELVPFRQEVVNYIVQLFLQMTEERCLAWQPDSICDVPYITLQVRQAISSGKISARTPELAKAIESDDLTRFVAQYILPSYGSGVWNEAVRIYGPTKYLAPQGR